MNRIAVRLLAVVVVVLLLAGMRARTAPQGPGGGAPPGTGLILGRVVDAASNTPVSGVLVSAGAGVAGPQNVPRIVLTDAQGRFVFRQLPQGRYTLSATIGDSGFSPSGFLISGAGYQIGAYLNGGYGQQRPNGPLGTIDLAEGEKVGDAVIRMWKGGAIEGTVFDEMGEPLVGVAVAAVLRDGAGRLLSGPTTRTDDRGQYHIGTLVPGDYVVVVPQTQILMPLGTVDAVLAGTDPSITARLLNAGATVRTGAGIRTAGVIVATGTPQSPTNILAPASTDRRFIYQSTFHPSATALSRATPIRLRSGETQATADVQLQPVTAVEVAGRLQDESGPVAQFGVHLLPAEAGDGTSVLEVAVTSTDARGQFVFPLVPSGSYRILAVRSGAVPNPAGRGAPPAPRTVSEQVGAWAEQPVTVGDQSVGNLVLTLRAGVQISGRVEYQGTRDRPAADRVRQFAVLARSIQPLFRDSESRPMPIGQVGASGEFVIRGVIPGRYSIGVMRTFVEVMMSGWTLRSVTLGGRDITDRALAIGDDDLSDVVVTLTDQPASLTGTVHDGKGALDPAASVFVFPTDRALWPDARALARSTSGGFRPWLYNTVRVSKTGAYMISSLVPGEYFLVAVSDAVAGEWPDERLLARLASVATTIRVGAGAAPVVALRTAEVR